MPLNFTSRNGSGRKFRCYAVRSTDSRMVVRGGSIRNNRPTRNTSRALVPYVPRVVQWTRPQKRTRTAAPRFDNVTTKRRRTSVQRTSLKRKKPGYPRFDERDKKYLRSNPFVNVEEVN